MSFVGGRGGIFLNKSLIFWACSFIFLTQRFHNKFYIFFGTDLSSISKLNRQQSSENKQVFNLFLWDTWLPCLPCLPCLPYLPCLPFDSWGTDYYSDNWELEFMTFFVSWQLRVTLDSIHNSCDVWRRCIFVWHAECPSILPFERNEEIPIFWKILKRNKGIWIFWQILKRNMGIWIVWKILKRYEGILIYWIIREYADPKAILNCSSTGVKPLVYPELIMTLHQNPNITKGNWVAHKFQLQMAISQKRKEVPEISWRQNSCLS